ncbi:MAG: hypothetical protein ACRELC_12380 [Gemmatimonadota bacterium]
MARTTRARLALLVAVLAPLVAGAGGGSRLTAGSQESPGEDSRPGVEGGSDGVVGICAAPIDRCDDTIEGPVDDPNECAVQTSGTGPEGTASSTACHDDDRIVDPGDDARPVEPTPGMAGVRPHAFDRAVVGDDGTVVTVFYWSGIEPCSILDHVDVAYGAGAVTITLFEGHDASAGDAASIEIALLEEVVIRLDEPVDGRRIVDGAS